MKNKDKTIALTLLAFLLYAIFVWHGITSNGQSTLFRGITNSVLLPTMQTPSVSTPAAKPSAKKTVESEETGYKRSKDGYYQFSKMKWDITGYALYKEGGKRYLIYEFTWVNTSDGPIDFTDGNMCLDAYQDGIECDHGVVMGVDTKSMNKIMPGKRFESYRVIELRNNKSKVETHISEYFVDIDPVVFNVDLAYISKNGK